MQVCWQAARDESNLRRVCVLLAKARGVGRSSGFGGLSDGWSVSLLTYALTECADRNSFGANVMAGSLHFCLAPRKLVPQGNCRLIFPFCSVSCFFL